MYKTFGTTKEVFVNQDEGMFVALPITLDETVLTLETITEGGKKYALEGSVVKEGDVVRGILPERYDITEGPAAARIAVEGYAWASRLTALALASASALPKIVVMPYKAIVASLVGISGLAVTLHIEGGKFKSTIATSDITVSSGTVSSVVVLNEGNDLRFTLSAAGTGSVTAIATTAIEGASGATFKGLPIDFTVAADPKYAVTATAGDNGSVSVDKATAAEGEVVTITATPESTYAVDKVTVDGVEITESSGTYSFVMPGRAVAVVATFKAGS